MPKTKLIALAAMALAGTSGLALAQSGYGRGPDDNDRFNDRPYHRFDQGYHHGYDYGRYGRGYDDSRMNGDQRYGDRDRYRGRDWSRDDDDDRGGRGGMDGRRYGRDSESRDWNRESSRNDDSYEDFRERFGLNDDDQGSGADRNDSSSQSQQSAGSDVPNALRQKLQKQGYSQIKIVPGSYIVRARDSSGDPVFMVIGPHSTTMITALTPGSDSSDKMSSGDKITGKSSDEESSGIDGSTNDKPKAHSTAAESAPATGVTKGPTSGAAGVDKAPDGSAKSDDQNKSKTGSGSGSK